jgi:NADPH:quinone reductase-like Zn-dependent oxidoreductase
VTGVTAWHALNVTGKVLAGDSVLIQGAGALSLAALQVAKMAGARTILLTRDDRRTSALRTLGADVVIARGDAPDWTNDVVAATEGEGADTSLDVLGGEFLNGSVSATRIGGVVHAAGYVAGTSARLDLFLAIRRAVTIHVATAGHRASFEALARALELHRVRPVIGETYALAELPKAFERMSAGGHFGKIVIDVTRGP